MMTQGTLVDATIIEAPKLHQNKDNNVTRICIRPRKTAMALRHESPYWRVDAKERLNPYAGDYCRQ